MDQKQPSSTDGNAEKNHGRHDIPDNPSEQTLAIIRQYAGCCFVVPVLKRPLSVLTLN